MLDVAEDGGAGFWHAAFEFPEGRGCHGKATVGEGLDRHEMEGFPLVVGPVGENAVAGGLLCRNRGSRRARHVRIQNGEGN